MPARRRVIHKSFVNTVSSTFPVVVERRLSDESRSAEADRAWFGVPKEVALDLEAHQPESDLVAEDLVRPGGVVPDRLSIEVGVRPP